MTVSVTTHDALIFAMVMASAVDSLMSDRELTRIGHMVQAMPVFQGFERERLIEVSKTCAEIVSGPEGLDIALEIIRDTLPPRLYDTAYAVAVEIMAADQAVKPEEIRLLQLLRDRLSLDKLTCAAIERSAIARYRGA